MKSECARYAGLTLGVLLAGAAVLVGVFAAPDLAGGLLLLATAPIAAPEPDMKAVKDAIEKMGASWERFQLKHGDRLTDLENTVHEFLARSQRPNLGSSGGGGGGERPLTGEERKALELGVRALISGKQAQADQHFGELKAMNAGTDPEGGYLVVPQFSTEMTRVMAEISPISSLARTVELTQGASFDEVVDKESAEASWVGETTPAPRTETTTPALKLFHTELHELCAYPKLSQKLIDVTKIDVVAWLQGKVAEAFGAAESAAFHSGNGVAKPRGFLTYATAATADATRTWGELEHIATGASGAFPTPSTSVNSADVLIDVISAMKAQYRAGARWMMNRATAGTVRKLKDADGRHVWTDSLVQGQPAILLGYPVDISEDMPAISAGSLSIAFANWAKAYTIIRRLGVRFLVDPYSTPPYVKLHSYQRVGGGVNNFEAIKLLKFS